MTTKRHDILPSPGFSEDDSAPASNLSSMQRAIVTIQKLRTKIEGLERARTEPIAIIGMGCRFPGDANAPDTFFHLLEAGIDAVTEVPPERWALERESADSEGEQRSLRWGAFLKNVDRFDAAFFGISPREAESLDPQQRLLLEVAWEALERAGQLPERLMGSKTGVFVGIWSLDYQQRVIAQEQEKLDAYCFTGNVLSTAAGRLAYTLGLQGPCMSVETACSSSLTAIHLACQSLRAGESSLALAGGVNLMLSPATTKLLSKTQALSPDGRCKTFDARANGFVRGEGCGILVLKRLSDAERDGDTILAAIRGSAVNQDGRSTGLTAPNVLSQQALLKQALESARLAPQDIGYIETHGTGTSLGDPIEMEAIKAVLGAPREKGASCILGAVKTNIGHLEAAAGVAGVMKVVLAMQHDKIPGNLHFRSLNPRIDLKGTSLEIAQEARPWPSGIRPRLAGVSSFGISGTNAHVIVEEPPRNLEEALIEEEVSTCLLPLSAKTPGALRDLARAYHEMLASPQSPRLLDIVYTASVRRSHYAYRLAVVGKTKEELAGQLAAYLEGNAPAGLAQGQSAPARAKVVFVFSGQGAQWLGMGRQLYESDSSFRSVIDTCDNLMTARLGWSILDELDSTEVASRMGETQAAQPLIFAVQIALVEMLRSWGIAPDAMIGHSVGEIAAAHIAGILSLDEATRLVAIRGRIMQKATGMGKMLSVSVTPEQARSVIAGYEDRVSIAAINDPDSIVLSGASSAIDDIVIRCEKQGLTTRPLRVNYAFHSPQMEPFERELVERLVRIDTRRATLAMYSTVLADCVDGKELDVRYWGRNIRETVDFAGAMFAAIRDGYELFLEVGPHPVLMANIRQCFAAKKLDGLASHTMRRNQDQRQTLLEAAGALYTRGCLPEWSRIVPSGGKNVPLPTYPWQTERYWIELPKERESTPIPSADGRDHHAPVDPLDDCVYEVKWRKKQLLARSAAPQIATWLVFADKMGIAEAIRKQFNENKEHYIWIRPGTRYARIEPNHYEIEVGNAEHYDRLLREVFNRSTVCRGVIHLFALDSTPWEHATGETLEMDQHRNISSVAYLVQALQQQAWRDKPKVWLVTQNAHRLGTEDGSVSPIQATLWGLGRTLILEQPEIPTVLLDLPSGPQNNVHEFINELYANDEENQIALRADGRYVARLTRSKFNNVDAREFTFIENSVYLITGGFGALGLNVARWMVGRGARRIALMGRNAPSDETNEIITNLEKDGARVIKIFGDVARTDDVAAAMRKIDEDGYPLRGIVHAAGSVGQRQAIGTLTPEHLISVFSPKVRGTLNLHRATRDKTLDFFVLYSSASALLGLIGYASYSAANAFLDAVATARVQAGLPSMSIEWGAFTNAGVAAHEGRDQRMASAGLRPLTVEEGTRALERLLDRPRANIGIFGLDLRQWFDVFPQAALSTFWSELRASTAPAAGNKENPNAWRDTFQQAAKDERPVLLDKHVRTELGHVFRMNPLQIDALAPFASVGVDSLMSLEVKNRLERSTGLKLPATLLFTYPTLDRLLAYLLRELSTALEPASVPEEHSLENEFGTEESLEDDLLADFDATMNLVKGIRT